MGVTLGYPSEHTDPRDRMIASTDEGQGIAGSTAIATSVATAGSTHETTARQPPADTETAAATSPTHNYNQNQHQNVLAYNVSNSCS